MLVAGSIRGGGQQGEDDEGTWYAGHGRPWSHGGYTVNHVI